MILSIGLVGYANSFDVPFHFDDRTNIVDNPLVKDFGLLISAATGQDPGRTDSRTQFSPHRVVGFLTLAVDYRLYGLDHRGYHLTNLIIHLLNALLVFTLATVLLVTPRLETVKSPSTQSLLALLTALVFVAHPIQTQAVTYVIQRLASLAALFFLLSVVLYTWGRLPRGRSLSGSAAIYLAALVAALLAMRTKENTVTLPLIIAAIELVFFSGGLKKRVALVLPFMLATAISVLQRIATASSLEDLDRVARVGGVDRLSYFLTQFKVIVTYIRLLLVPAGQNLDHDVGISESVLEPRVLGSAVLLMGLLGLALWLLRRGKRRGSESIDPLGPLAGFGILWFFLALSVESSIIPIEDVIFEHRIYLPSVGAILALVWAGLWAGGRLVEKWNLPKKIPLVLFALWVILLLVATIARNEVWKSEVSLWRDVLAKSPGKARAHNNLATVLFEAGELEASREEFYRALEIDPGYIEAQVGVGKALAALGRADEARAYLEQAARSAPGSVIPHLELGNSLTEAGRPEEAARQYRLVVNIEPDHMGARYNLGTTLLELGRPHDALEHLLIARELDPAFAMVYPALGDAYNALGRTAEAVEQYEKAVLADESDIRSRFLLATLLGKAGDLESAEELFLDVLTLEPDHAQARNNLGNVYLQRGRLLEAAEQYRSSLQTDPTNVQAHYNLAIVYDRLGQPDEAEMHRALGAELSRAGAE